MGLTREQWLRPDDPGWLLHPSDDRDWERLLSDYGGRQPEPLRRVIEVVRSNGARSVYVENRYMDLDYRSEFSAFWSKRFQGPVPHTHRLHFFSRRVSEGQLHELPKTVRESYLGYSVLRPISWGAVGRTVLRAPRELAGAVMTTVGDEVSLFGNRLSVEGVPFRQQDTEYLICAHAAVWICHYTAYRRGLVPRRSSAELAQASPPTLSKLRALPSQGLNLLQIQAVFGAAGQPAIFYGVDRLPQVPGVETPPPKSDPERGRLPAGYWDTRIFSVAGRYLNSGFPVLVGAAEHALVLVGWIHRREGYRFIVCDDQEGPYLEVDPFEHDLTPWSALMVPMPPRVLVAAESAETRAGLAIRLAGAGRSVLPQWRALREGLADGQVALKTRLMSNHDYKAELAGKSRTTPALRALRLARLPRFVWVVEAHDKRALAAGRPPVCAEVLFDPTSEDRVINPIAISIPRLTTILPPDGGEPVRIESRPRRWGTLLPAGVLA